MANLRKRLTENAAGNFFVDSTCINCDTCRQLAPEIFGEAFDTSYVYHQPVNEDEERHALRALLACPTSSIGTEKRMSAQAVMNDFPLLLEEEVYYCGFNSPKSYGGNSYLIKHPEGNWLVDSPKFLPHLVRRFREAGGVSKIFLTHRDDVADALKYAQEFKSSLMIHREDRSALPEANILLEGELPTRLHPEFLAIPTPGHTRGHQVLLYRDCFLFTGDHLWWNPEKSRLGASKSVCWYSWPAQIQSMKRLLDFRFEWVCPGHGSRIKQDSATLKRYLKELVLRMESTQ
jgi:glyoxylase-like metal-dependent hydrolase (beta-lactamase superfamily II)/ferredoxin